LQAGVKVLRHVFFGFEMLCTIPLLQLNFAHRLFLKLSGQGDSGFDVFLLVGLITTNKQDNYLGAAQDEINLVASPK